MSRHVFYITRYTSPYDIGKEYIFSDGKLIPADVRNLSTFTAETLSTDLNGLAEILRTNQQNQALGLGLFALPNVEGVPKSKLTPELAAKGLVARTKAGDGKGFVEFKDLPGFMLLDVDEVPDSIGCLDDVLALLYDTFPRLKGAGMVINRSSSAGISGPGSRKTDKKWHIYVPVNRQTDIEAATDNAFKRLWLAGLGQIVISSGMRPSLNVRSIIDASVASPERLVFESKAKLPDGFTRPDYQPTVLNGTAIDALAVFAPLSEQEQELYRDMVNKAKQAAAPEQDVRKAEVVPRLMKTRGMTKQQAVDTVNAYADNRLDYRHPIQLASGKVVPAYIAVRDHLWEYCCDPAEPELGSSKCQIYPGKIHSYLHCGFDYRLECVQFQCEKVREKYFAIKGIAKKRAYAHSVKGLEQAKWAYLLADYFLPRFGVDLPAPRAWLGREFPKMGEEYLNALGFFLDEKLAERKRVALQNLVLSRQDLMLKRDQYGMLDWGAAYRACQPHKLICVRAEHGSGKTSKFAKEFCYEQYSALIIAHRVSLTKQLSNELKTDHYQDSARVNGRLTTCVHSLLNGAVRRFTANGIKVVILDEATQLRRELTRLGRKSRDIFEELGRLLREADKVVMLDADFADIDVHFFEELAQHKAFVIEAEDAGHQFSTTIKVSGNNYGSLDGVNKHLASGEACAVSCTSRKHARKLLGKLREANPERRIILYADAPEAPEQAELIALREDPEAFFATVDCVVFTSIMGTGVSVENKRFTKHFQFLNASPLSPADCVQMGRRFRAVRDFEIVVLARSNVREAWDDSKPLQGFDELERVVAHESVHNVAYFATALTELLRQRGHSLEGKGVINLTLPSAELDESDARELALTSPVHPRFTEHQCRTTRQAFFAAEAYNARYVLGMCPLSSTISASQSLTYILEKDSLRRYRAFLHHETPEITSILTKLFNRKLNAEQCVDILNLVVKHRQELKRLGVLPLTWAARFVPLRRPVGAVEHLAKHLGFVAEVVSSNGERHVSLKAGDGQRLLWANTSFPSDVMPPEFFQEKVCPKAKAWELLRAGMSKAKVAAATGLSLNTVKRVHRAKRLESAEHQAQQVLGQAVESVKGSNLFAPAKRGGCEDSEFTSV